MTLSATKLRILEAHRPRLWGLCDRMTGERAAADDLAQETMARAVEHGDEAAEERFEGWMYRVATTACLDWLRRRSVEGRSVRVVDPVDLGELPFTDASNAESTLLRREDVRLALMTSLRTLPTAQRAVLVLRDVLDRSTEETALALGATEANVKVLLHRARKKLEEAHHVTAFDARADASVVEELARALESGDIDGLTRLLADDVWGIVDDGLGKRLPTLGARAVARQWTNAFRRFGRADRVARVRLNGESALVVILGGQALASIHVETFAGRLVSIRTILDPLRLQQLGL
jgi:RNA polymerase sigma-70 factor (ECF subfamily)